MNVLLKSIIAVILLIFLAESKLFGQSLADYQWKNRLVFIVNPDGNDPLAHPQVESFRKFNNDITDREILVLVLYQDMVIDLNGEKQLIDAAEVPYNNFQGVILIGKDGGVKLREEFFIEPSVIFTLIDSMPMRRAEMRSSKKN